MTDVIGGSKAVRDLIDHADEAIDEGPYFWRWSGRPGGADPLSATKALGGGGGWAGEREDMFGMQNAASLIPWHEGQAGKKKMFCLWQWMAEVMTGDCYHCS